MAILRPGDVIEYEYHVTATRLGWQIWLMIGLAIIAVLAIAVFVVARRRK